MSDTTHVTTRLPTSLLKKLDKLAKYDGRTRSNLVVRILTQYVEGKK